MADNLSEHLTITEMLVTDHRSFIPEQRRYWDGHAEIRENAQRFAIEIFEPVRTAIGFPLHVNSGVRSPGLNASVGGKDMSHHLWGLAVDVTPLGLRLEVALDRVIDAVKHGLIPKLDMIIIECGSWLHVQGADEGQHPRQLAMVSLDGKHFTPYKDQT